MNTEQHGKHTRRRGMLVPFLAAYRYRALLTQQELATRSGAQQHTIYRVESGYNADFKTIKQLADGLGITPEQLLTVNPNKELHKGVSQSGK